MGNFFNELWFVLVRDLVVAYLGQNTGEPPTVDGSMPRGEYGFLTPLAKLFYAYLLRIVIDKNTTLSPNTGGCPLEFVGYSSSLTSP